jgi:hypothetical protein
MMMMMMMMMNNRIREVFFFFLLDWGDKMDKWPPAHSGFYMDQKTFVHVQKKKKKKKEEEEHVHHAFTCSHLLFFYFRHPPFANDRFNEIHPRRILTPASELTEFFSAVYQLPKSSLDPRPPIRNRDEPDPVSSSFPFLNSKKKTLFRSDQCNKNSRGMYQATLSNEETFPAPELELSLA